MSKQPPKRKPGKATSAGAAAGQEGLRRPKLTKKRVEGLNMLGERMNGLVRLNHHKHELFNPYRGKEAAKIKTALRWIKDTVEWDASKRSGAINKRSGDVKAGDRHEPSNH